MLYTPHLLTGAVIVKYSGNPVIGLPLALISHFILDLMPHNDFGLEPGITIREFLTMEKRRRNLIIGALFGDYILSATAFVFLWIKFTNFWYILGGIAGILPDLVEQIFMLFGKALPGWQDKLQFRVSAKYGFIYYPVISVLTVYLLLKN